jgi:hypothetical protein
MKPNLMQTKDTANHPAEAPAGAQVKQTGGVTARVNDRGEVEWCNDWTGLLWLALRGHLNVKLNRRGEVIWAG